MHAVLIAFFALLPGAPAQGYGYGAYGALNCNQPYQAAPGAISPNDLLLNNQGLVRQSQLQLGQTNQQIALLNRAIARDRQQLQQFLGPPAILAMDAHLRYGGGPAGYQPNCGPPPAIAGPVLPAGAPPPTPNGFCVNQGGQSRNLWTTQFAGPNGRVNDSICSYQPGYRLPQPPPRAAMCRQYLQNYYLRLAQQQALQQRVAGLNQNIRTWQVQETEFRDALAEGQVCIDCPAPRSWNANAPVTNGLGPVLQILMAMLGGGGNRGRGGPPGYGGGYGGGAGPYPGIPYAARLRGYYGARNGVYGAVPGGIGAGAFAGCGGPGALGLGAQFAPPVAGGLDGGLNGPFGPQYANPLIDPSAQNALFNPGFGAGFAPTVGNGLNTPEILPLLNQNPGYGPTFTQQPQYQPNYIPRPLPFGQVAQYVPGQYGLGNFGGQFAQQIPQYAQVPRYPQVAQNFIPNGGVRPPPPPILPMGAGGVPAPAFGVGQGLTNSAQYGYLANQVGRAQYGLGVMQQAPNYGTPPVPPPILPMPNGFR